MAKENQKGLYGKYIISRADGTPIDPDDEYFVLKVAGKGDRRHIEACRSAIIEYADEIADYLPDLSQSILERYDYVECENCGTKLFSEDDIVRDSEETPLCQECYDALKDNPGFYDDDDDDMMLLSYKFNDL